MDGDVQLLHNRIKMLQMEEKRALVKIEATRKKAKKLLQIKLENEERMNHYIQ